MIFEGGATVGRGARWNQKLGAPTIYMLLSTFIAKSNFSIIERKMVKCFDGCCAVYAYIDTKFTYLKD